MFRKFGQEGMCGEKRRGTGGGIPRIWFGKARDSDGKIDRQGSAFSAWMG